MPSALIFDQPPIYCFRQATLRNSDLPAGIDIALPRRFSRTEMTPDQCFENLMTTESHDRAVLGVSQSLRWRVAHITVLGLMSAAAQYLSLTHLQSYRG